jgi:hypothetical protein
MPIFPERIELFYPEKPDFSYSSRSYQGRNRAPRKSTPSVSIAKASGLSLRFPEWPSTLRGNWKVPFPSPGQNQTRSSK